MMNIATRRALLRGSLAFLSVFALSATAIAQEFVTLEEIVVTARKRVEVAQDVPISISTMSADEISVLTANGQDLRFLNGRLPSVRVESSYGRSFPRFYIRGLGNSDFDMNASQPVSLIYDEIVLENPIVKGKPVFDLEQIEVARGPQGTLFGRNTPAGVIKLVTKKPTRELEGYAEASYGTYDTIDLNGAVGGGFGENWSARVSGQYIDRSDWVDNAAPTFEQQEQFGGYTQWALRGQLLWEPNDMFSGLLSAHGWEIDDGTARVFHANAITPGTDSLRPGFEADTVYQDGGSRNTQEVKASGASLVLNFDFDSVELISITGYETVETYSQGDVDGGIDAGWPVPASPGTNTFLSETADGIPDLDQITQEFRLASVSDGPFNWLVGLYYFSEEIEVTTFNYDSLNPPPRPANNVCPDGVATVAGCSVQSQDTDAWAVFGSVDWDVSDRWTLTAGLRYSDDEKDWIGERPVGTFNVPTVAPLTRTTSDDFVSWDLSATFAVNEDVNVYGRIATSNRAPSIQGRMLFAADFSGTGIPQSGVSVASTEDIISGEIGFKSELLDNRLRLNADVYVYQMSDQQVSDVGGAANIATLINIDTTDGYGFEADLQWLPIDNLTITSGLSYNNTEIDDPPLTVSSCGGGCTVTDPLDVTGTAAFIDGNSLPHAPEWVFNGLIRYGFPFSNGNELYGTFDWAYHDETKFFLYDSVEFKDDNVELGLRVGYIIDDRYEIAVFGRNISDETNVNSGIDFSNITGMVNDPVTWGVLVNAKFGQ